MLDIPTLLAIHAPANTLVDDCPAWTEDPISLKSASAALEMWLKDKVNKMNIDYQTIDEKLQDFELSDVRQGSGSCYGLASCRSS